MPAQPHLKRIGNSKVVSVFTLRGPQLGEPPDYFREGRILSALSGVFVIVAPEELAGSTPPRLQKKVKHTDSTEEFTECSRNSQVYDTGLDFKC